MARKTQNSSQSLPSAIPHNSLANEIPKPRTSGRKREKASDIPATAAAYDTPQQTVSDGENGSADSQHSTDDATEMDASEDQLGKPAVIAPSVRPSKEGIEQAGLEMHVDANQNQHASMLHQNGEDGHVSDDDDYAAVGDISDSSDDEPDVEKITKRVVMKNNNNNAHPTTNYLQWYEHEEQIQGMLGEDESFFDQSLWSNDVEPSMVGTDDLNYYSAWDGLPDTPMEPQTPMSLPSPAPSPRRVHFGSQTSSDHLAHAKIGADQSNEDCAGTKPVAAESQPDVDDNDGKSGYECRSCS